MVPIAAFLAGALLTLLLPVLLLIALAVWYWMFSARVPDTANGPEPGARRAADSPAGVNPAPAAGDLALGAPSDNSPPAPAV